MARPFGRALISLDGLSVGDAFGQRFFGPENLASDRICRREVPPAPWIWTDDTAMARVVVACLRDEGKLDSYNLSRRYAAEYKFDPGRGYGTGAADILNQISHREPWERAARSVFGGEGSKGNGAAMRAAPVGAYFAHDHDLVVKQTIISAEITHAHQEGIAGAIAVALGAAWASTGEGNLFDVVLKHIPPGQVRNNIMRASRLPVDFGVSDAVRELGNGSNVLAEDTVGYCLWCVARCGANFSEAMWTTVQGLGDRDTTCAIVGGIVALLEGCQIPNDWMEAREALSLSKVPD